MLAEGVRPRVEPGVWPRGFASGPANREALLVLGSLRGIKPKELLELAQRELTAAACLAAIRAGRVGSQADREFARQADPIAIGQAVAGCGARIVIPGTEEYPAGLEQLADPPAAVFVVGRSLLELAPRVAVVGARACSNHGREVAREIGRSLAAAGACVVSGAARGIDSAAHQGALDVGGATIAVLGSGIDVAYPRGSRSLIARIAREWTVVSEYGPGVTALPFRFPARNRIIAALAQAIVVVEGEAGSGSRISAEHALDLGRDVYVVPGAVNNPLAHVPLELIREGATMIRGAEDLLEDLDLQLAGPTRPHPVRRDLSDLDLAALAALKGAVLPEAVARQLGLSIPEVAAVLMSLELKGLVRNLGARYELRLAGGAVLSSVTEARSQPAGDEA